VRAATVRPRSTRVPIVPAPRASGALEKSTERTARARCASTVARAAHAGDDARASANAANERIITRRRREQWTREQ